MRARKPGLRRRAVAWGCGVSALVAVVVLVITQGKPPTAHSAAPPTGQASQGAPSSPPGAETASRSESAFGVQSSAIVAENAQPGTADWKITGAPTSGYVQGWADKTYAQSGETVRIYVSTTAPSYHVVAYRMGYYHGLGARQIWASPEVTGRIQTACPVEAVVNTVECTWTDPVSMPITPAFVQGDYLLKFIDSAGQQSYAPLTVWDPASEATYLFETHSMTAEAWNTYGGFSFYLGHGACPAGAPSYPVCNRARIVSFDRPYLDGNGSGDFLYNEYPLLSLMEEHGLDVAYVSDVALDAHPDVIANHRAFLSLGHDETWTYPERKGLVEAAARGTNVAFFSAAAIVRHARLASSAIGPDREVVEYRNAQEDPLNGRGDPMLVTGNTWASPPTSWPVNAFIGQQYSGFVLPDAPRAPFVVYDASGWIFKGTGLRDQQSVPDVIGSDIDHLDPGTTPVSLEVLGHSPIPSSQVETHQGSWNGLTYSDMTYYTDPVSKAGIFDSGAVSWIDALSPCSGSQACPAPVVTQMTGNLLRLFGDGPAGDIQPSVPNWKGVRPTGS